jgi:hypothetical protein
VYNWEHNNIYGGEGGRYNIVNNYFKYGPATKKNVQFRIVNPSKTDNLPYGKYYVTGNFVEGSDEVSNNNERGITMGGGTDNDKQMALMNTPHAFSSVITHSAEETYRLVLQQAGASFRRDTLDQRIVDDVRNRTGRIIDVQGGFPHGTPYDKTVTAWPILKTTAPPADADRDGMPDAWETKNGLNSGDALDAGRTTLHRQFTNIEVYVNSLVSSL